MKNRRSVGAEPYAPKKLKAITGGGKGRTTPVTTACMSSWLKSRIVPKKKITRRNDQSAISSNKEHVMYEATQTCSSVTYQHTTACTCPANDRSNGVKDHSNNKARHPTVYLLPFARRSLTTTGGTCILYNPRGPGDASTRNAAVCLFLAQSS